MTPRRLPPALLAALLAVSVLPGRGWGADRVIDYLYLEANEGGSSGGHVGLRVGDDVFHFEYQRPGILVLRREPLDEFRRHYTDLENRTMEVSRIPLSEEAYQLVRERFRRRHFVQQRHLETLDSLRADRRILEGMLQGEVALEGAGFFEGEGHAAEPALLALHQRVLDAYGVDFFTERRSALLGRLAAIEPELGPAPAIDVAGGEAPVLAYEFPQRYRDTLTALVALEVLTTGRPLRPEATITAAGAELALREDDAATLVQLSERLAAALVRLIDSRRPDWGYPLLLGMARLVALERTRASGQWVFLDPFPPDGDVIGLHRVSRHPEVLAAMLRDARAELEAARVRIAARLGTDDTFPEREFADLEVAGNRVADLRRGRDERRDPRLAHHSPLDRPGLHPAVLAPAAPVLAASLSSAVEREETYAQALARRYRYNLITRNCVSELLREVDGALLVDHGAADGSLDFIPALSALSVRNRYGVSEVFRVLSRRRAGLARLYEEEPPLRVFLRESNTVTSTLYRRNPSDSAFLFFTDDVVVTRPLFGAVNVIVGVATSAVGLATLPFDGGQTLRAGVQGMMLSLPELFFQNIRKGSFEYLEGEAGEAPAPSGLPGQTTQFEELAAAEAGGSWPLTSPTSRP